MLLANVKTVNFTITTTCSNNYFSRTISCKTVNFCNFYICFSFNSLKGRGPLFEAWQATFGPKATGWQPLAQVILATTFTIALVVESIIVLSSKSSVRQSNFYSTCGETMHCGYKHGFSKRNEFYLFFQQCNCTPNINLNARIMERRAKFFILRNDLDTESVRYCNEQQHLSELDQKFETEGYNS